MLDSPVRVALLARPGDARDQLRRALAELGARLVAEGDPAELDPGQVAGEKPTVVLVSLEPAIEDSLSRFDDLLAAPGIDVMQWRKPVLAGDTLNGHSTVEAARLMRSRPNLGIVTFQHELTNQRGQLVLSARNAIMLRLRQVEEVSP